MKDPIIYNEFKKRLNGYRALVDLPGLDDPQNEDCFIKQMVDSYKRVKFIEIIKDRSNDLERKNPHSELFDPIRAAILYMHEGNINEAVWNTFLYVHFGKNLNSKYDLLRAVYGKLGEDNYWTWPQITSDILGFKDWLDQNISEIKRHGSFGNHRKYQSLKINSNGSTIDTFTTFFSITDNNFELFTEDIPMQIKADKHQYFDYLYKKFSGIKGFGRLAVFDFVCMLGKIGIVLAEPGSPYLGNDGPIKGTKLLFNAPSSSTNELNTFLKNIGDSAFDDYPFIMQILEDCVCNWQKRPDSYKLFLG